MNLKLRPNLTGFFSKITLDRLCVNQDYQLLPKCSKMRPRDPCRGLYQDLIYQCCWISFLPFVDDIRQVFVKISTLLLIVNVLLRYPNVLE